MAFPDDFHIVRGDHPPPPPAPDRPIADKLQWLTLVHPEAMHTIERLVDHIIDRYTRPPPAHSPPRTYESTR